MAVEETEPCRCVPFLFRYAADLWLPSDQLVPVLSHMMRCRSCQQVLGFNEQAGNHVTRLRAIWSYAPPYNQTLDEYLDNVEEE